MFFSKERTAIASVLLSMATTGSAFVNTAPSSHAFRQAKSSQLEAATLDSIRQEINYKAGAADTEFAKRYGHLVGAKVKTVGEAFAEFTASLGTSINPLYKSYISDLVGSTHLMVVNARFQRDPVWCLGILTAMEMLLANYPEPEIGQEIVSSLFESIGMDEGEVRAESQTILEWAQGKSQADIEAALDGSSTDGPLASMAAAIRDEKYWMYSRYFGIGLITLMQQAGVEMDKDTVYPIMESWMSEKLGKSPLTACADSDYFFRVKAKIDMMETMMKEIEIREKKRMAERLELKAEAALRAAERESKWQQEEAKEKTGKEEEELVLS